MENKQIKIKENIKKRTFTIRVYYNNKPFRKYKTIVFSKEEFEELQMNTEKDWEYFLNFTEDCYLIKKYYKNLV